MRSDALAALAAFAPIAALARALLTVDRARVAGSLVVGIGLALGLTVGSGCGGAERPPPRGVIENDVGGWSFRRYQSVLDVEVWVSDNRAVAHTASYARKEAEKRGRLGDDDVVSAFVTRYDSDDGVDRALVQFVRRLASESGYRVEERSVDGIRLIEVRGAGEVWATWPSARHVVKIGGPRRAAIPEALIGAYARRYPSHLAEGALEAPLPGADEPGLVPDQPEPRRPKRPKRGKRAKGSK
jgi:hypothetical protein